MKTHFCPGNETEVWQIHVFVRRACILRRICKFSAGVANGSYVRSFYDFHKRAALKLFSKINLKLITPRADAHSLGEKNRSIQKTQTSHSSVRFSYYTFSIVNIDRCVCTIRYFRSSHSWVLWPLRPDAIRNWFL